MIAVAVRRRPVGGAVELPGSSHGADPTHHRRARVARGDPIRTVYRAVNRSHRRSPAATIVDSAMAPRSVCRCRRSAGTTAPRSSGSIPTRRRGVFQVGPTAIERVDALGLAVGDGERRRGDGAWSIPRLHNLTGPYGAMHTVEDEALIRRSASDPLSGFVSLREYCRRRRPASHPLADVGPRWAR